MAADLLFHETPLHDEEIVRRINGNWLMLRTPRAFVLSDLAEAIAEVTVDADCVVLLSPLATRHRGRLGEGLSGSGAARPIIIANPETTAQGALFAARRIECGIPHYLDHLDQVSLIVMRGDGPAFEDLIPTNATVPGNREYISAPITSMMWTAGMAEVQFYIRKGPHEIRRWVTPTQAAPERNERLEIHLRQMPAQGWATLSVTAAEWETLRRAPIFLDWSLLEIDPRSEAEIFATLQRPRPAVPRRVHYESHIGLWDGSLRKPGLRQALAQFKLGDPRGLSSLADAAAASYVRSARHPDGPLGPLFAVGTDGELPNELAEATRQRFFDVVNRVSRDLLHAIEQPAGTLRNNDALRFLTWIFAACPPSVQGVVLAAFEAVLNGKRHPLLDPPGGRTVVIHGLGRIIIDRELIGRLIPLLCDQLPSVAFLAPLASLLSRPIASPQALSDLEVEAVAEALQLVLRTQHMAGTFGPGYKYALMVVGGLLRAREHEPWALTSERSGAARGLAEELRRAADRVRTELPGISGGAAKHATTLTLIEYLETNEGRPDILTVIDGIEE
jgi:hypothetical protein